MKQPQRFRAPFMSIHQRQLPNDMDLPGKTYKWCRLTHTALWTLALSVIPDYQGALKCMDAHVQFGGRVVITDVKRSQHLYGCPLYVLTAVFDDF